LLRPPRPAHDERDRQLIEVEEPPASQVIEEAEFNRLTGG
jgi:hypothetical protein